MDMTEHNEEKNTLTLKNKKYEIEFIAKGGFGEVFKARQIDKDGHPIGEYVAIKKIIKKYQKLEKLLISEIDIHPKLVHPNILKVFGVVKEKVANYLILELCEHGTLQKYVEKHDLNEEDVHHIFKQIVEGVKYLHSKQIIHRDLTLSNILLTKDWIVKIADFGLSTRLNDKEEPKYTICGTPGYAAPEVKRGNGYKEKVDCWNLGCILYALLNKAKLPDPKKPLHFPPHFSLEVKELLQKLLNKDDGKRICVEEVEESAFFKKYERNSKLKNSLHKSGDSGNGSQNYLSSPMEKESHFRSLDSGFNSKNSSSKKSKSNSKNNYSNEKLRERRNFDLQKDQLLPPRRHLCSRDGIHDRKRSASEDRKPYKPLSYNNPQLIHNSRERSASAERARLDDLKIYHYCSNDTRNRIISSDGYKSVERYKNNDCGINSAGKAYLRFNPEPTEHCDDPNCKFSNSLLEGQHPSTCSHAGFCNTKCSHVATCCCHSQSDHKRHLSNSNIPERLNEHSLEQKTSPLNAARLRPKRYMPKYLNNMVLHISEDFQVIMETLKTKKRKLYVSEVFAVSTNGMEIKMYKPPKNILLDDEHPLSFPKDSKEIKSYDYKKLPKMYHGRYLIAKQFVDILRAKKPKLINNGKNARFYVMENGPDPDMKMEFYGGGCVTKKDQKIIITNKFGRECVVVVPTKNLDQDFKSMLEEFLSEKEDCEALLKLLESHSAPLNYPIVLGEVKNGLKCSEQNTGKENFAPSSSKSNRRHKDR